MIPHLLCYQGLAVKNYSCGSDALDLQHPRLLQQQGLHTIPDFCSVSLFMDQAILLKPF